MKKILFLLFILFPFSVSAQILKGDKSLILNAGIQTENSQFLIGIQGNYSIIDNLSVSPDVMFYIKKDDFWEIDIDLNLHYLFGVKQLIFYPLAGICILNTNNQRLDGISPGKTDWGFNLGGGVNYKLPKGFLSAELKHIFTKNDTWVVNIGYGINF